jgi:hypothetical protein
LDGAIGFLVEQAVGCNWCVATGGRKEHHGQQQAAGRKKADPARSRDAEFPSVAAD